jgi:hypothetical protein
MIVTVKPARMTVRLSRQDVATIRAECEREGRRHSSSKRFKLEIGERVNIEDGFGPNRVGISINALAVSRDPAGEWNDTDLHDKVDWQRIRQPIELTADGRAVVDVYVYEWDRSLREWGDLVCNAQAELDDRGLVAMHADKIKNRWRRP